MFNASSAVTFNKNKNYSMQAISLMQEIVGASTTGKWDTATVTKVRDYKAKSKGKLDADGKIGQMTLGAFIGELRWAYRDVEANILKQYPHVMPSAPDQPGQVEPILKFFHHKKLAFRFEKFSAMNKSTGAMAPFWQAACEFQVMIELNPHLGAATKDYEYRQYIRGEASVNSGNRGWVNANEAFKVPASSAVPRLGIHPTTWKEDGIHRENGTKAFFGHRSNATANYTREKDLWLPKKEDGATYLLHDTPALAGLWQNLKIELKLNLQFRGEIVKVTRNGSGTITSTTTVRTLTWQYNFQSSFTNYNSLPKAP